MFKEMNKELMDAMANSLKTELDNSKIRISADVINQNTSLLSLYHKAIQEIKEIIMDPDNIHLIDEIVEKLEKDIRLKRSKTDD